MNCSDIQELLSAYANGELPRLPGGPYEGAASAHFLKSGTSVLLGGTSEVAFDWEFIAPDSYHGTTTRDGLVQEFILVSDEQYTRDFAGTQSPGSVVIVTDNIYSPIPSREGTLRLLNSLTDVEQLPNERIGNVDTSHYLGRVDIHRILDEQLAALDPNAQGYQETLAFVDLQRTAQISIELWIDEEAYRIQQMKVDSQFPIIVSGPNGVEQQGSSGFSTVVRYSDFNSAIEIKRPLTASGNVIAGWRLAYSGPPEPTIESGPITPQKICASPPEDARRIRPRAGRRYQGTSSMCL